MHDRDDSPKEEAFPVLYINNLNERIKIDGKLQTSRRSSCTADSTSARNQ
jgi:hypothetical protein